MAAGEGHLIGTRTVTRRVSVLALLVGMFHAVDWMPFRAAQRDLVGWSLGMASYAPEAFTHEGSPALRVGDHAFSFTAECTYLDLLMIVAPFLWVFGASLWRNILRIGIAALVILGGNLIRCWASVYFFVRGIDWFYTHDLPDYIMWWPTVAVVVLLALRRDFRDRCGSPLKAHATEPASEGTVDNACAQAWRRCSPSRRSVRARSGAGRRDA